MKPSEATPINESIYFVPKSDRRRTNSGIPAGYHERRVIHRHSTEPDEVARRAFELWLQQGCAHGHDFDHWLQAERELELSLV